MTLCRVLPSTKLYPMPANSPHKGQWKRSYDKYKHSRTFGEYMVNGALPIHVAHDVMRGIVRFKGPFRAKCLMPGDESSEALRYHA